MNDKSFGILSRNDTGGSPIFFPVNVFIVVKLLFVVLNLHYNTKKRDKKETDLLARIYMP